jgi:phosphatase NudJ
MRIRCIEHLVSNPHRRLHKEMTMVAKASLFVLGVFTHRQRFLLVQERDGSWYLPAGKVEEGESLLRAVARETDEEAATQVSVQGLLGFDHSWAEDGRARLRFVFRGARVGTAGPKRQADRHSLQAAWLTRAEMASLRLRHPEVLTWVDRCLAGAVVWPTAAYEWLGPEPARSA